MDQQYSLRWNNYLNQITDAFGSLKKDEDLVDVTLSCEGKKLKAHKMLLSACSPYFREVFKENPCQHPVIVFRNFKYVDLEAIVNFMYKGEVDVKQEHFESFLGTAEVLEVKGLTEGSKRNNYDDDNSNASKIDSGNELLSEDLANRSLSPRVPSRPHSKKRKSSTFPEKGKSSEKKQKAEPLSPIIPKIEQEDEELIEDLTFDEEDTDDSHSTSTDLSHVPLRRSRPDIPADYGSSSVPDQQDPSQLPKGHAHLPEAGSSVELLPPEVMQTQDNKSTRTENTENKKVTEEQKDAEQVGRDENKPDLKPLSAKPAKNTLLQNLNTVNSNLVSEEKPENQNESTNITNQNMDDTIGTAGAKLSCSTALNLPKGLTVTLKEKNQKEFGSKQSVEEEAALLRSEEAKTPVQEELSIQSQIPEICSDKPISYGQLTLEEPEMAEEAPQMVSDEFISEVQEEKEEEVEPEFDYFGCETCKAEAKPVDRSNLVLNHKCPICPCVCFCAHLLKEHMKFIHGWFNVKRRYNQY